MGIQAAVRKGTSADLPDARPFLIALDAVDEALGFFDRRGGVVYANRRLRGRLADPVNGDWLRDQLRHFVEKAWARVRLRSVAGTAQVLDDVAIEDIRAIAPSTQSIHLRAGFVGLDLFGTGETLLIRIREHGGVSISDDVLRQRYGLTRRESRIARLIAHGMRNDEIAHELSISPHTVRRHTEQIFLKLGVRSRTAVAGRIVQEGADLRR